MACPTCGRPGSVSETRASTPGVVRRRYRCAGGHGFTTFETHAADYLETTRTLEQIRKLLK